MGFFKALSVKMFSYSVSVNQLCDMTGLAKILAILLLTYYVHIDMQ